MFEFAWNISVSLCNALPVHLCVCRALFTYEGNTNDIRLAEKGGGFSSAVICVIHTRIMWCVGYKTVFQAHSISSGLQTCFAPYSVFCEWITLTVQWTDRLSRTGQDSSEDLSFCEKIFLYVCVWRKRRRSAVNKHWF